MIRLLRAANISDTTFGEAFALPVLQRLASAAALRDTTLAARVRAAPWFSAAR